MGIGAVFGAILTMYTAVSTRSREIATLRALGFNTTSVVVSVLAESLALAAIGGAIGGVLAYFAFNGYQTSTMNFSTFSQVAFAFQVTPQLLDHGSVVCPDHGIDRRAVPCPARRAAADPLCVAGSYRPNSQELTAGPGFAVSQCVRMRNLGLIGALLVALLPRPGSGAGRLHQEQGEGPDREIGRLCLGELTQLARRRRRMGRRSASATASRAPEARLEDSVQLRRLQRRSRNDRRQRVRTLQGARRS